MKGLYAKYAESMWKRTGNDISGATLRLYIVDTDAYTADLDADEFLDDIAGGAIVGFVELAGVALIDNGRALDFNDPTFTGWSTTEAEALVLVDWSGDPSTSPLIHYNDEHTGLPITGNGVDVPFTVPAEGYMGL